MPLYKFTIALLTVIMFTHVAAQSPLGNTKRILFIGNSITYAGGYVTDVEAYFMKNYPNSSCEFINAGLPSETVSGLSEPGHAGGRFPRPDLHERLDRLLKLVKPDIVFACYGINDGIYMPFDQQRFIAFQNGINWLHQTLVATGVKRIIHITPFVYDDSKTRTKGYNDVITLYSNWLVKQTRKQKWEVIDLHRSMTAALEEGIKKDSSFQFAKDGIHPGMEGHWLAAKQLLRYLKQPCNEDINIALLANENDRQRYKLIANQQAIMKDAWLSAAGHLRPDMNKGLPLQEALQKYKEIETQIIQLSNTKPGELKQQLLPAASR